MRLLFVIPTLSSYQAFLSDLALAAIRQGHSVHVATSMQMLNECSQVESQCQKDGVQFHAMPTSRGVNPMGLWFASRRIAGIVEEVKPDWIQAHFSVAALVCALAKRADWPFTSCLIQGLGCTLAKGWTRIAAWAGERVAMSRLDEMWVLTEDDYALTKKWNRDKARLQEAPGFGCRIDQFDRLLYPNEWCIERRSELSIHQDEHVLIYTGRLVAFKGFDRVVTAYRRLKSAGLKVRILLIGDFDPLHTSGLSDSEIDELRNDSSVIMPGWQENVAQWLAISDLFVFPSQREGVPVCLMEAIAMGVPILTSSSRGCCDVVRHQVDGIVLNDFSSQNIAAEIELLIQKPDVLARMKSEALSRREHFDRKHFIREQLLEIQKHQL